jgi:hypothetical protein
MKNLFVSAKPFLNEKRPPLRCACSDEETNDEEWRKNNNPQKGSEDIDGSFKEEINFLIFS